MIANKIAENKKFPDTIKFLRQKDFKFVKKLGQGACGETILIKDEIINEDFVCKKYLPCSEEYRETLYKRFLDEIKILHKLNHKNIVRVFNYYLYPDLYFGYILMEFINGKTIDHYINEHPENINEIFEQVIDAFVYLEQNKILHRDIRKTNIMVTDESEVKIIDFGFSKIINNKGDSNKSISLNQWCEIPEDFEDIKYNNLTEIYFIGKLFELLIHENNIEQFQYTNELRKMCQKSPIDRISSFENVQQAIKQNLFIEMDFDCFEKQQYQAFSSALSKLIYKINTEAKYKTDINVLLQNLDELYKKTMLEVYISDNSGIINCFINGGYNYSTSTSFHSNTLKEFLKLFKNSSIEKKKIILSNLQFRLDAINRYNPHALDDDIPF